MKRTAALIDGGYLRVRARKQQKKYTADLIEKANFMAFGRSRPDLFLL